MALEPTEPTEQTTDFGQLARALRRRWPILLLTTLLGGAAAYGISTLQTPQYDATAKLLFRDSPVGKDLLGSDTSSDSSSTDPARQAETNVNLVGLEVVSTRTSKALGGKPSAAVISDRVKASSVGQSDVVAVTATDPHPSQAKRLANTFSRQFIAFRASTDRAKVTEAQRRAERELESLSPADRNGPRGQALERAILQLGVLEPFQTGNAELVQPADLPTTASTPQTSRNVALGAVLGLLVGFGLIFLLERMDRRVRTSEDVETIFELPLLAEIPKSPYIGAGMALSARDQEAFQRLRSALRYSGVDREARSILFTSAAPGEGKSTVAWYLAAAAAATGTPVVVVEADLRRPSLSWRYGLPQSPGLTEVLTGQVYLEEAITTVAVGHGQNGSGAAPAFDVIVAGQMPPNPAELLDSEAMQELHRALNSRYGWVLIDAPAPTVVSDAYPMLAMVNGVIVVCGVRGISRDAAADLREQLDRVNAPVLGVVANLAKLPRRHGKDTYGYAEAPLQATPRT